MFTNPTEELAQQSQNEFAFVKLTQSHLESLIACIQTSFPAPNGEVMAKHLGIFPEDYLSYTEIVCAKAADDGLTYLAYHQPSSEVASFLICETMISAPQYSAMRISPKFRPLIAILEMLDRKYHEYRRGNLDDTLHLYMLGTAPEYRRFGLGRLLISRAIEDARRNGFKRLIAEATGLGSQALLENMGFTCLFEEAYRDYNLDGTQPFKDLTGPTHCKLVEYSICNDQPI
jgi:ribosomal protein S18 acetylase RimI-like enzyme